MEYLQMLLESLSPIKINMCNRKLTYVTDPKVAFFLKAPQLWKVSSKFTERPIETDIQYQPFHSIIKTQETEINIAFKFC